MERQVNDYRQQFMARFSRRRRLVWYACIAPASILVTVSTIFPHTLWLIPFPAALMVTLACFQIVRYVRNERRAKKPAERDAREAE